MIAQASLNFELAEPDVKRLVDMVRTLMKDGNWWTPWELCDAIHCNLGIRVSDSSSSARIRDLRKAQYGAHIIRIRKRSGSRAYEYRMDS
jgi:hypothetical protein